MIKKLPVQKGMNAMGEVGWFTNWRTVPTGHDAKQCSPS